MTQCIVYDNTTHESETFFCIAAAKKWMKERIHQLNAIANLSIIRQSARHE